MTNVNVGGVISAAIVGSAAILASMYFLMPALGLPRLDFTAVTGGWVGATGRYAKLIGIAVFLLGGFVWAYIFARFWPYHSPLGGVAYALIPFVIAMLAVMPQLNQFKIMIHPVPGFIWVKVGGPNAVAANLIEHVIFGLCLGLIYR